MLLFALVYLSGSRPVTLASLMLLFRYLFWFKGWEKSLVWMIPIVALLDLVGLVTFSSGPIGGGRPAIFLVYIPARLY